MIIRWDLKSHPTYSMEALESNGTFWSQDLQMDKVIPINLAGE